jgi:cytochrome c-type biogenesis protein CcmH
MIKSDKCYQRIFLTSLIFLLGGFLSPAEAAIEIREFENAAMEADYQELISELRCLVCQNQNLAESDADLAKDLRQQTFEMLQQGKNRQQVVDYMVARYGDFVLYRPPVKSSTLLLWLGPFVLLLSVLIVVVVRVKRARSLEAPNQDNLDQARQLLKSK